MDKRYEIIYDDNYWTGENYWIRDTSTYISGKQGYTEYYKNFFKTKKEFEEFVKNNFAAYKGQREVEVVESIYSVFEGEYTKCYKFRGDEMKYKYEFQAQNALEWLNSSQILDKLAGI